MFGHLLESSHRDDSNKWSNIGFGEEISKLALIVVYFTHLIWSSAPRTTGHSTALLWGFEGCGSQDFPEFRDTCPSIRGHIPSRTKGHNSPNKYSNREVRGHNTYKD